MKLPKLPTTIKVDVKKGESGALVATLSEYDVSTQAHDLAHLFLQVNDLIYTFFDVPKKYQEGIRFNPSKEAQEKLMQVYSEPVKSKSMEKFTISS